MKPRSPSRFLGEIPEGLYENHEANVPTIAPEDEEAFARAQLDKLKR